MIVLRDYQADLQQRTGEALRRHNRVLLQCPPGGGKTAIATSMLSRFGARQKRGWFICHRAELVQQTSLTFSRYGLAHGFIVAGYPLSPSALVQVCSIDTLKNRLDRMQPPDFAMIDECHHSGAAGWALVIQWLVDGGCKVVGLSGTPRRHDGSGLDQHYDELVLGPAVSWLMAEGHLSQYEIFAPDKPDMGGIRKLMGDYSKKDAAERMDKPKLTGNIIHHWKEHARGILTLGYGVHVAHSQHLAEEFRRAGVNAVHMDGGTNKNDRRDMMKDFGPGGIELIFNCSLFGEGLDLAALTGRDIRIGCVIDAAPTMSLSWHLQKQMRCMRPGPPAIILDHAGNCSRHGFPDDDREWSLEGAAKGKSANDNAPPPPINCDGCFRQIRRPAPQDCPHCGKRLAAEFKPLEVEDAPLKKMTEADKKATRQALKEEERACKDLGAMIALGVRRGVEMPVSWGHNKMLQRKVAHQKGTGRKYS
jgi:superfamily II DNA or RNA helicase